MGGNNFRFKVRGLNSKAKVIVDKNGRKVRVHRGSRNFPSVSEKLKKEGWVSFADACFAFDEHVEVFYVCIGILLTAAENGEIQHRTLPDFGIEGAVNADSAVFIKLDEALELLKKEFGSGRSLSFLNMRFGERDWFFRPKRRRGENFEFERVRSEESALEGEG